MEQSNLLEGSILLIDKPLRWTSFDVVKKTRNLLRTHFQVKKIKVGHAGTLDPLASGLLVICTGKFTKRISEFQAQEKEYTGTFTLGSTTPSYDLETEINQTFSTLHITEERYRKLASNLLVLLSNFLLHIRLLKKTANAFMRKLEEESK